MAEEFQGGVSCGGNWWNLPRKFFGSSGTNDVANLDWPNHDMMMDLKATRSSDDSAGFSSSEDWNQDLFHDSGRSEDKLLQQVEPLDSSMNFGGEYSYINSFKQVNGNNYPLHQQPLNSIAMLSAGFPLVNSVSYSYTSSLLQTLFDPDNYSDQPQQSLLDNNQPMNNNYLNYDQINNISKEFLHPSLPATSPMSNLTSVQVKQKNEKAKELASHVTKKASNEPAIKRARIQTPSPLPTFKVRKEKLGDRVTALQQLVSPFGKTDTASVLYEAIEYIKFLHDQVSVLSTPYLKNGSPPLQHVKAADKVKDREGLMQDLKSRGVCLVPISSTFPVTAETTTDFWTPMFGESFK